MRNIIKIKSDYYFPAVLDNISEQTLRKNLLNLELETVYWDDIEIGNKSTMKIKISNKLILFFILLTNNFILISNNLDSMIAGGTLLLSFISGLTGIYLLGAGIFLIEKKEAEFYHIVKENDFIIVQSEIVKKWTEMKHNKTRYFVEISQKVYLVNNNIKYDKKKVLVGETGAVASVLNKSRPDNIEKHQIKEEIHFFLPKFLENIDINNLKRDIKKLIDYKKRVIMEYIKSVNFNNQNVINVESNVISITSKMVLIFAYLSNDFNPLHCSKTFASNLPSKLFNKKNISHGALNIGLISGVNSIVKLLFPNYNFKLIKKKKGQFIKPLKFGDKIIIKSEMKFVKDSQDDNNSLYLETNEDVFLLIGRENEVKEVLAIKSGSIYQVYCEGDEVFWKIK
ncbi:MAG: MaoC/PaaZ C-terminal domain-containing protein [Candidatus Helarchaeota archaeon]